MRIALRFGIGFAVSAVFIWLALRDKDLAGMWQATLDADYRYVAGYFVVLLVIHMLRTLRFGVLLAPLGRVSLRRLNRACAVGFMALIFLPFRLGELARPYMVSARAGEVPEGEDPIPMSAAIAAVVIERVADGLCVASLLLVSLVVTAPDQIGDDIEYVRTGGFLMLGFFTSVLAVLVALLWQRERAVQLARALVSRVSAPLADRVVRLLENFLGALRQLPGPAGLALFFVYTALYWGVNGGGMLLLASGFGLPLEGLEVYTVLGVLVIGVMIPAGPGMLGTFQYFLLIGLGLFVPAELLGSEGAAYANVLWASQFLQMVGLGLFFLVAGQLSFGRLVDAGEEVSPAGTPGTSQADPVSPRADTRSG